MLTHSKFLAAVALLLAFVACSTDPEVADEVGSDDAVPVGGGGWFCCDLAGNCGWIGSQNTQDCPTGNTVKWCKATTTSKDGTTTCSEWGE